MTQDNLQDERLSKKNSVDLDSLRSAGTFELQDKLPLLPIPELKQTCEKFLVWVKPLLNDGEFQKTSLTVKKFMQVDGEGAKLQQSMIEWSQGKGMESWLEDLWEETYLSFRKSLPVNSNVFYVCDDNPSHKNLTQTQKAAALIISVLQFKELIDSGTLEVDHERCKPLCMVQYKRLFNSTRIPLKEKDVSKNPFSKNRPTLSDAGYIMVHCQGRLFSLNVYEHGRKMRKAQEIERDLAAIRELANEEPELYSCGILTTLPRDEWAEIREYMITVDSQNELLLDTIEGAIFSICLEDSQPETLTDTSRLMMHGDGKDRWFDKSLQLIVCRNGTTALNVEHSRLDGSVIGRLQKHILGDNGAYKWQEEKNLKSRFQELRFKLNGKLKEDITRASHIFDELIKDTHVRVLEFVNFGKDRIKSIKASPDAFVQMAIQLAQFNVFGQCYNTYEAVMTRRFLHGRTEAMRSVTPESVRFVQKMNENSKGRGACEESLREAVKMHVERLAECKNGQGVQRHLFGLLRMYEINGSELNITTMPEIFTDTGWKKICYDRLSTSTSGPNGLTLAGYGPVVDDGFGVRYVIKDNRINFNISSKAKKKDQLNRFVEQLEEGLNNMADLLTS
jgi:carnitine O-acetyltransferase